MSEPTIKSQLESTELTTDQPDAVRARLSACLASDPQHIAPGQRGDHVKALQSALEIIRKRRPEIGLMPITDPDGNYGASTRAIVRKYKEFHHIVRTGQSLDDIIGRMTISQIDNDLARPGPRPVPPKPAPEPIPGIGGIQIGPGHGPQVVSYYQHCGLETIGPGRIGTKSLRYFSTLEDLIDLLTDRSELHQVFVNHGDARRGLLLPIAKGGKREMPDSVMMTLADLADNAGRGSLSVNDLIVGDAVTDMGINAASVVRVANKLASLRRKPPHIIHIRGCNIGKNKHYVADFKLAFRAIAVTAPTCRMTYQEIPQNWLNPGKTFDDVRKRWPPSDTVRNRIFEDPLGFLQPLIIVIMDCGATKFSTTSLTTAAASEGEFKEWRTFLIGKWTGAPKVFVLPALWEDADIKPTFYCPLEEDWRKKLLVV